MSIPTMVIITALTTYVWSFVIIDISKGEYGIGSTPEGFSYIRSVGLGQSPLLLLPAPDEGSEEEFVLPSVLDDASVEVLLDHLETSTDMYLLLPLGEVTSDSTTFAEVADAGYALVGGGPEVAGVPRASKPLVWGSLPDAIQQGFQAKFGGPVAPAPADSALPPSLVDGRGRTVSWAGEPVVMLGVADVRRLGVYFPTSVGDVAASAVCQCSEAELSALTDRMTHAQRQVGSATTFMPASQDDVFSASDRAENAVGVLSQGALIVVLPVTLVASSAAGLVIWRKRKSTFAVELAYGTSRGALHARMQTLVAIAVTVPTTAGFIFASWLLNLGAPPPPWSGALPAVALGVAVVLQVCGGASLVRQVGQLSVKDVV